MACDAENSKEPSGRTFTTSSLDVPPAQWWRRPSKVEGEDDWEDDDDEGGVVVDDRAEEPEDSAYQDSDSDGPVP